MSASFESATSGALVIDDQLEALIPRLTADERSGLRENILAHGIEDPLKVWSRDGNLVILDGHNRYEIAVANGLEFRVEVIDSIRTLDQARVYMLRRALDKRSLTAAQRIALALQLKPQLEAEAKERERLGGIEKGPQNLVDPPCERETRAQVASAAQVSREQVRKAETVFNEAAPEVVEAVKSGERSIHSAYQEVRPPKAKAKAEPVPETAPEPSEDEEPEYVYEPPPLPEKVGVLESVTLINDMRNRLIGVWDRIPESQWEAFEEAVSSAMEFISTQKSEDTNGN